MALLGVLAVYYAFAASLPHMTLWWEIVFLGVVLIPAIFGITWLALPLWRAKGLGLAGAAFGVLAVVCEIAALDILADFSKLAALTLISFWFLGFFETVLWVALVAAIIPAVDAFSVFRGPTGHIVEERPSIFETIAFGFPVPGRRDIKLDWESAGPNVTGYNVYRVSPGGRNPLNGDELIEGTSYSLDGLPTDAKRSYVVESVTDGRRAASAPVPAPQPGDEAEAPPTTSPGAPRDLVASAEGSFARLGPPDILFFGLFLAAAARFRLRIGWTWVAMAASFGTTLALAVWLDLSGLPALPLLSLGFLIPNADLIWRELRKPRPRPDPTSGQSHRGGNERS
jgi:hypothetical protein